MGVPLCPERAVRHRILGVARDTGSRQSKGNLNLTVFVFMSSKVNIWLEVCKVVTLRSVYSGHVTNCMCFGGRGTLYLTCIQTDVNLMMFVVSRCVSKSSYLA